MKLNTKPMAPTWLELALGAAFLGLVVAYAVKQHASLVPFVVLIGFVVAARRFPREKIRLDTSPVVALVTLLLFAGPLSFVAVAIWRPEWTLRTAAALAVAAVALYIAGGRVRRNLRGSGG